LKSGSSFAEFIRKKNVGADNLKKLPAEKNTKNIKLHLHTRKEAGFSVTTAMTY
jgi:hypothetical protein